ncbi:diglucosyl diacylglycerol synthase [Metabacillus sediminilitoris]|uniref:Diglucosyl diacylglycerol synthase n=1 Tax=Metabacillus sediminilitoris TaxID=2567941 RepID=A0A4S4C0Z7_9BACI|nr:diglucosyl diacylglycerol synthase [Metabacillus sediminilitoris]QGQ48874.1 diglucosyl diacylglycerol synthase [Metabacillus sediminilitoris]THF81144.1 diglucosyl diacylglycerol synthase [Metabacillus sediminilitoris]
MVSKSKVLILTEKYGNGHVQVAKTLQKECEKMGFGQVIITELYKESHPLISQLTKHLYIKSFSYGKRFYKLFYYGVDKMYNKRFMNLYYALGYKRLSELIQTEKPDMIINTFPMMVVPEYRDKTGEIIPTFNVVTDFCLHKIWVHKNIDKYYVASEQVKKKILELGVKPNQVRITGIPIREQFEHSKGEKINNARVYTKYNLDPTREIVLIMAGAHGVLKNVDKLCESLSKENNLQIVIVCGKNETLKKKLDPIAKLYPKTIIPLGYVENVDELFRISSCMITKPGGITLSEATALGVPVILYKPVPGQERENALFFEKKKSAVIVNDYKEMKEVVLNLLEDKKTLEVMRNNIKKMYHPNAAKAVLEDMIEESYK